MNDVIRFKCSACGATMKVPGRSKGKRTKCPKCGNPERVPEAQLPAVVEKPRLPTKVKPAPIVEMVDDDVFVADMLKELPGRTEQTITFRETQIVSREIPLSELAQPLPHIRATALTPGDAPPALPAVPQPTKACRFCGEQILETAIKCKHCSEFLDGRPSAPPPTPQPQQPMMMPQININTNSHNTNEKKTEDVTVANVVWAFIFIFIILPIIVAAMAR